MTSDRSLWDASLSSEEVAERLVQLGRAERVSPERRAQAVESILSAGLVGVTQATAAHASAVHALSPLSKAPVAKISTPLLFVKSAATGAIVAGALLAGVQGVRAVARRASQDRPVPATVHDLRVPAHGASAMVETEPSSVETRSAAETAVASRWGVPLASSRVGNVTPRARGTPSGDSVTAFPEKSEAPLLPSTDTSSSLSTEVRALDVARLRLRAGDVVGALSRLDAYRAEFPAGALSEEATAVRVEALMQWGRKEEASALAQTFFSLHPTSPVAKRIRLLVSR
jgi:hypothetical protein